MRYLGTKLRGCPYCNGTPVEGRQFGDLEQLVIFPPLRINPSCYPTAKLNERELCTVQKFYSVQILSSFENLQQ